MLDGYMETQDFIDKYLPTTWPATNGTETKEVEVTWEPSKDTHTNYIPTAQEYLFKPIAKEKLSSGWKFSERYYDIEVRQSMVQISLGVSDWKHDRDSQTVKKTIDEKEYTISFGTEEMEGVTSCKDEGRFGLLYLPKDALVQHKNADGNTGYHLIMTIEGENAENAYPVLINTSGFLTEEEYEEYKKEDDENPSSIAPESYLIDAQPGKAVFAIPIRIDSFESYEINFDWDGEILAFDGGNSGHTLTLDGSVEGDRTYAMSFTDGVDGSADATQITVDRLGKVFFEVAPPDDDHAWAVMVIPNKYVQADEKPGVNINTDWGREVSVGFSDGHRYFKNSLFQNSEGEFVATYLTDDMTAVISEITLEADETPAEVALNEKKELSVTADYQYEKLYGMSDVVYQWYQCDADGKNATVIDGATEATYEPPTDKAGTYYYYVTAQFEQFTEPTSYEDVDGNPLYFYDPYGWASDTVTKSGVMTLVVGEQSEVEVEEPEQETDGFVYGGEVAFLRFVVTVGDDPVSSEQGTVTIYRVNDDGTTTEIYEQDNVELGVTLTFTYDTLEKGLEIGENTIRIVYTSDDEQIADTSKDLTITLEPKEIQAVLTDTEITKVYDGTDKATVNLTLKGVLEGDEVTVTAPGATYDSAEVGTNKTINLGALELSGKDAEWYKVIAPTEAITGSITGGGSSSGGSGSSSVTRYPVTVEDSAHG